MHLTCKNFTKGQKAYIWLINDAARSKKPEECLKETIITSIGRKYINTPYITFKESETDYWYGGMEEKTNYSVDYILFATKEQALEAIEQTELIQQIRKIGFKDIQKLSITELKNLYNLLNKNPKK